jgi:hypothetical protein
MTRLDASLASRFARIALGHVTREYPNKLDHVLYGEEDALGPRALHPVFYGSFDWHSCVHGYWLLASIHRLFPTIEEAPRIASTIDAHFTTEKIGGELAYLERPGARGFERPYGWAWLLALAAELTRHTSAEGERWSLTIDPLARAFAERFEGYLPRATYPIRAGTHANGAFALALASEWTSATNSKALDALIRETATRWYGGDRDCQGWEPGGDDFLSPALVEAECMRRVLPCSDFVTWLDGFLPRLAKKDPPALFVPATVSDRSDGKIAHLDGVNLSRAWCFARIASALPADDPRSSPLRRAADDHLAASLAYVAGDYMGEHWLATYALLALLATTS